MDPLQNVKPIFDFAVLNGDAKIVDRILIRTLPLLLKHNIELNSDIIKKADTLNVPEHIYLKIKAVAEELTESTFNT